jgi:hypothetical protein
MWNLGQISCDNIDPDLLWNIPSSVTTKFNHVHLFGGKDISGQGQIGKESNAFVVPTITSMCTYNVEDRNATTS